MKLLVVLLGGAALALPSPDIPVGQDEAMPKCVVTCLSYINACGVAVAGRLPQPPPCHVVTKAPELPAPTPTPVGKDDCRTRTVHSGLQTVEAFEATLSHDYPDLDLDA
ncbi:hypothetical protein E4U42_001462 [Claviceps africana]|uniref:Uncharacterized protein n=1 Tax=Claviceps africana TaxID=83212 RepID=A0A8K0JC24_9HYPO|nr:hypothetical protein E4U42_001462 [Claviceps africana]